jgi:hypothetical protein
LIIYNSFVRRQTAVSRFGHTTLSEEAVLALIERHFVDQKPGYREGVILVPVPPEGFFSSIVDLEPGMRLRATYEPRVPGEAPRLHVGVEPLKDDYEAAKQPAVAVDIVLYASTVLAEDGSNELPAEPGNWEVISINPRPSIEEVPIAPNTLMANHFHESGGTATGMTDSEFVNALRKSRAYWNTKVTLG